MPKQWYMSKTVWFAIFTTILGIASVFTTQFPELQQSGALLTFIGVINVLLRLVTSEPIQK